MRRSTRFATAGANGRQHLISGDQSLIKGTCERCQRAMQAASGARRPNLAHADLGTVLDRFSWHDFGKDTRLALS
jgi:hypothetical protein